MRAATECKKRNLRDELEAVFLFSVERCASELEKELGFLLETTRKEQLAVARQTICKYMDRFLRDAQSRSQAMYWLLRAYHSGHREGWEKGPSTNETMDGLHIFLCGEGLDPGGKPAKKLLEKTDALR